MLTSLYKCLTNDPTDNVTHLAVADYLEECGDNASANTHRYMVHHQIYPLIHERRLYFRHFNLPDATFNVILAKYLPSPSILFRNWTCAIRALTKAIHIHNIVNTTNTVVQLSKSVFIKKDILAVRGRNTHNRKTFDVFRIPDKYSNEPDHPFSNFTTSTLEGQWVRELITHMKHYD